MINFSCAKVGSKSYNSFVSAVCPKGQGLDHLHNTASFHKPSGETQGAFYVCVPASSVRTYQGDLRSALHAKGTNGEQRDRAFRNLTRQPRPKQTFNPRGQVDSLEADAILSGNTFRISEKSGDFYLGELLCLFLLFPAERRVGNERQTYQDQKDRGNCL